MPALSESLSPLHTVPAAEAGAVPRAKKLSELNKEEMHELIDSLAPKKEMLAGIQLFHRVLDATYSEQDKAKEFLVFVEKSQKLLQKSGKLLRYDFEPQPNESLQSPHVLGHTEHLKGLRVEPRYSRRHFFKTITNASVTGIEAALGVGFAAYGVADLASASESNPQTKREFFKMVKDYMDEHKITGLLDVGVGVVFVMDAARTLSKIQEEKEDETFEQISNAVSEFGQRVSGVEKPRPTRRKASKAKG